MADRNLSDSPADLVRVVTWAGRRWWVVREDGDMLYLIERAAVLDVILHRGCAAHAGTWVKPSDVLDG